MDLDFSEEQDLLRESVARIGEAHFDSRTVRALEQREDGFHRDFWAALGESGIWPLRIGAEHGGADLGALELAVVFEELGRALASSPFLPSCVHAAALLASDTAGAIAGEWLRRIAEGSAIVIPAWIENDLGIAETRVAELNADGTLTGAKVAVPFASIADAFLVRATRGGEPGWVLVPADAAGVITVPQPNYATQPLFAVRFDKVRVSGGVFLPSPVPVESEPAFEEVLIAAAAEAVGASSRLLAITVDYANQRNQFDRPIAAFQAISHPLAECATELEAARYLTYQAACAKDAGLACGHLARMAKYAAARQFRRLATVAVQVHGGIGYSKEGEPQLYYRRSKYHELMHGTADALKASIADHVLA